MRRLAYDGKKLTLYVPKTFSAEIACGEDNLRLDYIYFSGSSDYYNIKGWELGVTKEREKGSLVFRIRGGARAEDKLHVQLLRNSVLQEAGGGTRMQPFLLFVRQESFTGEEEQVEITERNAGIAIYTSGLLEIEEVETKEGVGEGKENEKITAGNDKQEIWKKKQIIIKLGEQMKCLKEETERLDEEIKQLEREYQRAENDLTRRRAELEEKKAELESLRENGKQVERTLLLEYQERLKELRERLGDDLYMKQAQAGEAKKAVESVGRLLSRLEKEMDEADQLLIAVIQKNEQKSRELGSAIFDNSGKWVN